MRIPLPSPSRTPPFKATIQSPNGLTTTNINNDNQQNQQQLASTKSDQLPPPSSSPFTTKLTINNGGVNLKQQSRMVNGGGQQQKMQSASSSRMLSDYEISSELSNKIIECLENKYGGREIAQSAATKIQSYFRGYQMRKLHHRRIDEHNRNVGDTEKGQQQNVDNPNPTKMKKTLANTIFKSSIGSSNASPSQRRVVAYQFQQQQQNSQSQPTLSSPCQPTTSLSSQLRAERQHGRPIDLTAETSPNNEFSPTKSTNSIQTAISMRSRGRGEQQSQQRNPLMDTPATPRLCQRRIKPQIPSASTVFSANPRHQPQPMANFHPELFYSNGPEERKIIQKGTATVENKFGSTTILVDDYENITESTLNGQNDEETLKSGYHRSQSPGMHSSNTNGLQIVQLLSSPGRSGGGGMGTRSQGHSPSSSPMRHPQPPPLPQQMPTMNNNTNVHQQMPMPPQSHQYQQKSMAAAVGGGDRSVWMPRQLVNGASAPMHQQQIQQRQMNSAFHQQHHLLMQQQYFSSSSSISSVPAHHQFNNSQQMMNNGSGSITAGGYSMQQQQQFHHHQNRTPLVSRSHSSAATCGYQTGSLPRIGRQQQILIGEMPPPSSQHGQMMHNNGEISQNIVVTANSASSSGGTTAASAGIGAHQNNTTIMHLRPEWSEQKRRRLYRIALNFFNKKPDRGVQLLIRWGFVEDSSHSLAQLFKERKGLSKQMIGEYLGTLKSPFHAAVLEHFIAEIPMYDMEIDKALRQLLMHFRLPGEAQKIDHIIQAFAHRYVHCNPHRLSPQDTPDTVYILAFAVIMLNTDLHTPSLKDSRRMKLDEFIKNLSRVEEGRNLDKKMLTGIYERVKEFEFRAGTDHVTQVLKVDQSIVSKDKPKLVEPHRRLICYCRLHQIADINKRQSANAHQREIFLFNDLMLVCKLMGGRRSSTSNSIGQYQLRCSSQLIGLHVEEFQNSMFSNGMFLHFPDGQILAFNAKNCDDRSRFIADIRESVAESTEMEQWRIQLQMEQQQQPNDGHHSHLMAGIGARLAEHSFQLPQNTTAVSQHQQRLKNGGGIALYHQHHNNASIGSSTASAGTTVATTTDSIQRDSGLPDMDCCQNSMAGHSHSTASSPTSTSPSPADFT